MLTIDGSQGEGGGQILRSALSLSLITGTPFRLVNIRAGRAKPGLMRQHLTAVQAAGRIGQAEVSGAAIGSREITFAPGQVSPGDYEFAVGSAGSTTLIVQTLLPPLLMAKGPSRVALEGGTHNPHAPPFDFLARTFVPLINRMGASVTATLDRAGFYPAGGGRMMVTVNPAAPLRAIELPERGTVRRQLARAVVANLPLHVAERELRVVRESMKWPENELHVDVLEGTHGPGNVLFLEVESDALTEVFTGFGQRGVPAETVARQAVEAAREYLAAGVPVGPFLADQLLLPLALAGGGSFVTLPLTPHSHTNIEVIKTFLSVDVRVERAGEHQWRVTVAR